MKNNKSFIVLLALAVVNVGFVGFLIYDIFSSSINRAVVWCASALSTYEVNIPMILVALSLGSILFWLVRSGITMYRFSKLPVVKSNQNAISALLNSLDLNDKVCIFRSNAQAAFCFGLVDQKIYLSTGLLKIVSNKELEAILLHEKYHLQNKHFFERQLILFIAAIYPLAPIVADFARTMILRQEQRADQYALNNSSPAHLLSAIGKMVRHSDVDFVPGFSSLLEDRILNFNSVAPYRLKLSSIAISLVSLFAFAAMTSSYLPSIHVNGKNPSRTHFGYMGMQTQDRLSCEQILMSAQSNI